MNTSVLRIGARGAAAGVVTRGIFEPAIELMAQGVGRVITSAFVPVRLMSEGQELTAERRALSLAAPLIEKIRSFDSAIVYREQPFASEVSPLVQFEAVRLAVFFARTGLELTLDGEEVAMPSVHQTPVGAVQFEWHRKGFDLEILILPSGRIEAYVEHAEQEPREIDLTDRISLVEAELHAVLRR